MSDNTLIIIQIIVAIIIGVVSWVLAVIHTKKSISEKKLRYKIESLAMISDTFLIDDLKISYKETLLTEPIVVSIHITNSGNVALEQPPIEIRSPGKEELIPLGLASTPAGYEDKWKIKRDNENKDRCYISLDHINPKQIVKAIFLLDKKPKNKSQPKVLCAMKNLELEEVQDRPIISTNLITTLRRTLRSFI
ncbi:MAG TPA: hypothetical protein VK027_00955 [Chitinophagaceae bacterium]|nr:hypothetical protein [Chitinophagaceae bacterium]